MLRGLRKGEGRLSGPTGTYDIFTEGQTPCSAACPAGVDIKAYVNLVADRKYEDAVRVIRMANPFPGICGRVCTHPCEAQCGRRDTDQAVSIRALKRFAADYELSRKAPAIPPGRTRPGKVAVVGSGPAGLTAAADLAMSGFHVTVFDSSKEPGGLLSWGIPDFRLPKNIVRSEIRDIAALGVDIVSGRRVERPAELLDKGYSAVILATGCQKPITAGVPGEGAAIDCLEFLRGVSEDEAVSLGKTVVVIGGGNAALDSARTALRLGAQVTVAYRRTEEEMPADPEEIAHAREEGVRFEFLAIPVEMKRGSVRFQRARLGEPDDSGRRSPVPVPGEFFVLAAESAIMAIGSKPDASPLPKKLRLTKRGTPELDDRGMTTLPGIFAAGDLATGPSTIVDAIGSGHCAASGVMEYLAGIARVGPAPAEMLVVEAPTSGTAKRCSPGFIPMEERRSTFAEAEAGIAERDAIDEALRCRRCGSCDACDVCLAVCDYRNAYISLPGTGEGALAKVPFEAAAHALDSPEGWALESGNSRMPAEMRPLLAREDERYCIACGRCEEACPYKAIRTVFDADGNASARVELSACRGCGACVAACPAGAMAMGYMGDADILPRLHQAVTKSDGNGRIVRFSCIWNNLGGADPRPWEVRVQCTRRLSPAMLVEALALGARAVTVLGCGRDRCHYLPGPWMGPDVVESARAILAAVGVSPARVSYIDDPDALEGIFLSISGLNPLREPEGKMPGARSGLGRCLNTAQVLMAQPDHARAPRAETLLGCGCLAVSEPSFAAYGMQDEDILGSAMRLLDAAGVSYGLARQIHTPGTKLLDWGMPSLHELYMGNIRGCLKESGARTLMVPTPSCCESLARLELGCKVISVPAVLRDRLHGRFPQTEIKVAYHPACKAAGEFDRDCLELLALVPGLVAVRLEGACGDTGWADVTADTGRAARALLKLAGDMGAGILVAGSPRCAAQLRAATLGWDTGRVRVMDIYTFMESMLGGGP